MRQFSADDRLLLGTCSWAGVDWSETYYPHDLPGDWWLGYYANDCDCVFLPADEWRGAARAQLLEALDEAPEELVLFLELPVSGLRQWALAEQLRPFEGRPVALLAEGDPKVPVDFPLWLRCAADTWVDAETGQTLQRWTLNSTDLRALRARADDLGGNVRAIVIDGVGVTPAKVPEMRTMLGLMGKL